jgi:ATP-dependent RNA helicase DeaD
MNAAKHRGPPPDPIDETEVGAEDELDEGLEDEAVEATPDDDEDAIDEAILALPAPIARAFLDRGYRALTQVQRAVLDPALARRDLRISSQTGSGKTAALGLVLLPLVTDGAPTRPSELPPAPGGAGRAHMTGVREAGPRAKGPRALVIVPTRELARQVEEELSWLYQHVGARVASVSGGASYRDEHRSLARNPVVIVATPGRLLDHLTQGSFDPSGIQAVVLDEADQMLDLGFAEDLEQILARVPDERSTHLVSATFAPEVLALADRVQRDAIPVQGTRLGVANADIEHVVHLVDPHERVDALVNLLLLHDDARTLVFTRTRAGAQEIAELLHDAGFRVAHISGELAQRERTRTLSAFKDGSIRALVATDVAARGIDVQDVGLVVHVDAPTSPEAYTHRSGRTGRAGKRGTSAVLASSRELAGVSRVLGRARIPYRVEPVPAAEVLRAQAEARAGGTLAADDGAASERARRVAERLPADADLHAIIARLLDRTRDLIGPEPREVRILRPPPPRAERPRPAREPWGPPGRRDEGWQDRGRDEGPRVHVTDVVPFVVTWGGRHGADPRRVLAMVCRRGNITNREVGAIHVLPGHSIVEVRRDAADAFFRAASEPDPRDQHVRIEPYREQGPPQRPMGPRHDAGPRRPPRGDGGRRPPPRR